MKIRIDKAALIPHLVRCASVAAGEGNGAIAGVHLSTEGDELLFGATDYELRVHSHVAAEVLEPGEVLVNAKALTAVVRSLPEGAVIQLSGSPEHVLTVTAGRSRWNLNGMVPDEFPPAMPPPVDHSVTIDRAVLASPLRHVLPCVSSDQSRSTICGVLLEIGAGKIRAVSTDGHRMAIADCALTQEMDQQSAIVGKRGAAELQRLMDGGDPSLTIEFAGKEMTFASNCARLTVRPTDGTFPDYRKIEPAVERKITMDAGLFKSALRRVTALGKVDAILRLAVCDMSLSLDVVTPDKGDAHEEVETDCAGDGVIYGFNPAYMLEAVDHLGAESVTLGLGADVALPATVTADEVPGVTYILMPMRI